MTEAFVAVNKILRKPLCATQWAADLKTVLSDFVLLNEEGSSTYQNSTAELDDMRPLLSCLEDAIAPELDLLCTKMLKILLRKQVNRVYLNEIGIRTIVIVLRRQLKLRGFCLVDICNVVTNACFDAMNAQNFVEEGGMDMLLAMLIAKDVVLLASLLRAMQTLCYIPVGRRVLITNVEALSRISACLGSEEKTVRSRAAGVIHNLSVDLTSLAVLRDNISLPLLVQLLRDSNLETLQAATGTLQNVSRDFSSKSIIMQCGAIEYLADLLSCADVSCQVAAVGALFNLLGDSLQGSDRDALREIMVNGVVLGALRSAIFEHDAKPDECAT